MPVIRVECLRAGEVVYNFCSESRVESGTARVSEVRIDFSDHIRVDLTFFYLFVLFTAFIVMLMPTHIWEGC